ncbi:MAG: hypothetical protein ABGY41_20970, partial [Candidatus Poribacteria bacterium]
AYNDDDAVLAADEGSRVLLWDTRTGRQIGPPIVHIGSVRHVEFHPTHPDLLLTLAEGDAAYVWDLTHLGTATTLVAAGEDGERPGYFLAAAEDANVMVVGSDGAGRLDLWDTDALRPTGVRVHVTRPTSVALNSSGSALAAVSGLRDVYTWDTASGALLVGPLPTEIQTLGRGFQTNAVFTHSGSTLATGGSTGDEEGWAGVIQLWDPRSGSQVGLMRPRYMTVGLAFTPDDAQLIALSHGGGATIWDVAAGEQASMPLTVSGTYTNTVEISRDGAWIATGSDTGAVQLWDAETRTPIRVIQHAGRVGAVLFNVDSTLLAVAVHDEVHVWDLLTGDAVGPPRPHAGRVTAMVFTADGHHLVTSTARRVLLWPMDVALESPDDMERQTWLALGHRLDEAGAVETIPWQEWQDLKVAEAVR